MNSEFTMILFCVLLECVYSHSVVSNCLWPHGLYCTRLLCPWNSPEENTGVGYYSLLQGMFPTQGLNLSLLLCRQILYHLSHQESPYVLLLACYLYLYKNFFLVVVIRFSAFSPNGYRRIYFFNRLHATVNLKNAQCESCESSFIWGQNEDCSLGASASDNFENLPQRGQYMVKWEYMQSSTYFSRRFLLVSWSFC